MVKESFLQKEIRMIYLKHDSWPHPTCVKYLSRVLDYQEHLGKSGQPWTSLVLIGMLSGFEIAEIILRVKDILGHSG